MARYPKDMLEHMLSAMKPGATPSPEEAAPPRPKKRSKSGSPGSGGPFALGGDRPRRAAPSGPGGAATVTEILTNLGPAKLAIIQVLLLLAAFLLGRASRPIHAQEPAPGGAEAAASPLSAGAAGTSGARAEPRPAPGAAAAAERPDPDAALKDPRNRFTIMVVTYADTADQRDMARATHAHLRRSGFPVFRPYLRNGKVLLLVGAAPRKDDLNELRNRLRDLASPRGRREFQDAYVVAIEEYVQR